MKFLRRLTCKACSINPVAEAERKLFPRFCIGHVALVATGIILVIMEWTR